MYTGGLSFHSSLYGNVGVNKSFQAKIQQAKQEAHSQADAIEKVLSVVVGELEKSGIKTQPLQRFFDESILPALRHLEEMS
jgi:hypothetical protein